MDAGSVRRVRFGLRNRAFRKIRSRFLYPGLSPPAAIRPPFFSDRRYTRKAVRCRPCRVRYASVFSGPRDRPGDRISTGPAFRGIPSSCRVRPAVHPQQPVSSRTERASAPRSFAAAVCGIAARFPPRERSPNVMACIPGKSLAEREPGTREIRFFRMRASKSGFVAVNGEFVRRLPCFFVGLEKPSSASRKDFARPSRFFFIGICSVSLFRRTGSAAANRDRPIFAVLLDEYNLYICNPYRIYFDRS